MQNDQFTNQIIKLKTDHGHVLNVIDWGNKGAKTPFIFLHGGPGGHIKDHHKENFDPTRHRVIFFDQRGCGESTPYGSTDHNTTEELIKDITKIADHFKIKDFNLYGYSWGSTLALAYAIANPARVRNLVIGGVYSGRNDFSNMFSRLKTFYPEMHNTIIQNTPETHRKDPTTFHQQNILNGTKEEQKKSAYLIGNLEYALMNYDLPTLEPFEDFDPSPIIIENHYVANDCFLPQDHIIKNAPRITAKTYIVQGRSDFVTPPDFAYQLVEKLPHAQIFWADSNHHSRREIHSIFRTICALIA